MMSTFKYAGQEKDLNSIAKNLGAKPKKKRTVKQTKKQTNKQMKQQQQQKKK